MDIEVTHGDGTAPEQGNRPERKKKAKKPDIPLETIQQNVAARAGSAANL